MLGKLKFEYVRYMELKFEYVRYMELKLSGWVWRGVERVEVG